MSIMACNNCPTVYGPTEPVCPNCGSTDVGRAEIQQDLAPSNGGDELVDGIRRILQGMHVRVPEQTGISDSERRWLDYYERMFLDLFTAQRLQDRNALVQRITRHSGMRKALVEIDNYYDKEVV